VSAERGCYHAGVMDTETTPDIEDDDDDDGFERTPADEIQQVSSYIAIIRIVAVLGMGLCVSFGLFLTLVGIKGVIIGIPIILLSIPCYYGMQFAERLAMRESHERESQPVSES
jgi:hypothetical protein